MTIAIVDTSVLCELLGVPGKSGGYDARAQYARRLDDGEHFVLPLATVIETGNHISHGGTGGQRREVATRFVELVKKSLNGETPFAPAGLPSDSQVGAWLENFVDDSMRGLGLGDRSIVALWDDLQKKHPLRRVYVWTLDQHLRGYDTHEPLST